MRKLIATLAAAAVMGAALIASPSATAGHVRNVYACNGTGTAGAGSQSVLANPGDTIRVWNNCAVPGSSYIFEYAATNPSVWAGLVSSVAAGSSRSAAVLALGTSSQQVGLTGVGTNITVITVNSVSEPVPPPPPFVPHDYLQQVVMPASGSCDDVPAAIGHWHGAPMGGWSASWAWWPNRGTGGPVCTREVETTEAGVLILVG